MTTARSISISPRKAPSISRCCAACRSRKLTLARSNVVDLTPLRESSVKELDLSGNPVQDLSPLAGLALEIAQPFQHRRQQSLPDRRHAAARAHPRPRPDQRSHAPARPAPADPARRRHHRLESAAAERIAHPAPRSRPHPCHRTHSAAPPPFARADPRRHRRRRSRAADGAPLRLLDLSRTAVRSVAPLRGAPLRELLLGGCAKLEASIP